MPFLNLIEKHISAEDKNIIDQALGTIEETVKKYTANLTPEERQKYGSIHEKNKLFANKVNDYYQTQPELSTSDVDWPEYVADYQDRSFLDTRMNRMSGISLLMQNAKTLHDYDNYKNGLIDYDYTKYKAGTVGGAYEVKYNELKQFFPNTGGSGGGDEPQPPTPTE